MTPEDKATLVRRIRTEWPSGILSCVDEFLEWSANDSPSEAEFQYRLFRLLEDAYLAGRDDYEADLDLQVSHEV